MSGGTHLCIAMREALKYEGMTEGADCTIIEGAFTTGDLAVEAYCAGRTAPASDLEIREAALALFQSDTSWASNPPKPSEVWECWENQTPDITERYYEKARLALEAARKMAGADL